jgi:hypothetical protein
MSQPLGNVNNFKGHKNINVVEVPSSSKKSSVMSDTMLNLATPKPQQTVKRVEKFLEHKTSELFNATVKNKSVTSTGFSASKIGLSTAKNENLIQQAQRFG